MSIYDFLQKIRIYNCIFSISSFIFISLVKKKIFHQDHLTISTHFSNDNPISIVIYIVYASKQKINPDLRGHFWEPQLKNFPKDRIQVNYISDQPMNISGLKIFQPEPGPWQKEDIFDHTLIIRTTETWKHFVKHYPRYRWYFKGGHDTYINIFNLKRMIHDLELKYNPMKDIVFRFSFHELNYLIYPHGGSGFLISNAAIRQLSSRIGSIRSVMNNFVGDDTIMPYIFENILQLNIYEFNSPDFIISFPYDGSSYVHFQENNYSSVPICPDRYQLFNNSILLKPVKWSRAVSAHMHNVPMDRVVPFLENSPRDLAFAFNHSSLQFYFCKALFK